MRRHQFSKIITLSLTTAALAITPAWAGEWKQEAGRPDNENGISNWWYQEENGTYPINQWKEIGGVYYYFDQNGWMLADTETPDHYRVDASGAWIQDTAPEQEKPTLQEMVQWFNNPYAVLTESNSGYHSELGGVLHGGVAANEVKYALEASWGVTDRASADETLSWALERGHRAGWLAELELMHQLGFDTLSDREIRDVLGNDTGQVYLDMKNSYARKGAEGISGWDYGRAMQLIGWYYVAGYYSYEEALDKSLEVARIIQPKFTSWDDLTESYLRGYEYWRNSTDAYTARKRIYDRLKASSYSPYWVDWNLNLQKVW